MTTKKLKEKLLANLKDSGLDALSNLYMLLGGICDDYSRMTDGYSLATGDKMFEDIPDEIRKMIDERQQFYNYRNIVKDCIANEIKEVMENAIKED